MTNEKTKKPLVIAIAGPTGTGKSEIAVHLAKMLKGAEILSMDSMQVYRGLDIGTAKISQAEMDGIPHHLLDIAEPDTVYTVSDYQRDAGDCIDRLSAAGTLPILTGGTGLYLNALSFDLSMGDEGADPALRESLRKIAETEAGRLELFERLRKTDPASAEKLHPNDVHRVVRAIEIFETTGRRKSELAPSPEGPYHVLVYGLSMDRERLYQHLNERVDRMLAAGWMDEVEGLMNRGIRFDRTDGGVSQAIGYPELAQVISGQLKMETAVDLIKRNTRRYAKRQWTWFRHDPRVVWFDIDGYPDRAGLETAMYERVCSDMALFRSAG